MVVLPDICLVHPDSRLASSNGISVDAYNRLTDPVRRSPTVVG